MHIASDSDRRPHLTASAQRELRSRGHHAEPVGLPDNRSLQRTVVASAVAETAKRLNELDRHYRVREVRALVDGDKGRV